MFKVPKSRRVQEKKGKSMSMIRVVAAVGLAVAGAYAQAPAPAAPAGGGNNMANIVIKTTKIGPNFWILGPSSTIGVFAGPDGVFLVDSQFAPLHDKIVAAIRE